MPFYEVHIHRTEDLIGRLVVKADNQEEARRAAHQATDKDHEDVVDYKVWDDEWIQLGEIASSDAQFNLGEAYWDANLSKWTSPKKYVFANEEESNTPVGNPKRLGRSVDWTPYDDQGHWGNSTGRPGRHQRAETFEASHPRHMVNKHGFADTAYVIIDNSGSAHPDYGGGLNTFKDAAKKTIDRLTKGVQKYVVIGMNGRDNGQFTNKEDAKKHIGRIKAWGPTHPFRVLLDPLDVQDGDYTFVFTDAKLDGRQMMRAEEWTPPEIEYKVNDSVDAYELGECPWCSSPMEQEGTSFDEWHSFCETCEGSLELQTNTENIIVSIEPPTEKWTSDLKDFSAEQTPKQLVEEFRETVRVAVLGMMKIIDDAPNPSFVDHDTLKNLVDSAFQLGYNSGNIDGKWEMKQQLYDDYAAEGRELDTPIVDRAMRLHMMIERATRHAMFTAMQQEALLSMLTQQGPWVEHEGEEDIRSDYDWTPEEFGMVSPKELVGEIDDMEDHLGDLETQYRDALAEDNEDLEYLLEEKIIECKEDIEYLIHLLYEVEASHYVTGGPDDD